MSEHSEVVRDYVALRNYLAKNNPKPNTEFEVDFRVERGTLLAINSLTGAKIELAQIHPRYTRLYISNHVAVEHRRNLGLGKAYEP